MSRLDKYNKAAEQNELKQSLSGKGNKELLDMYRTTKEEWQICSNIFEFEKAADLRKALEIITEEWSRRTAKPSH